MTTNKTRLVFLIFVLIGLIFSYINFNLNKPHYSLVTDNVNRFVQTYYLNEIEKAQKRLLRSDAFFTFQRLLPSDYASDYTSLASDEALFTYREWDCNQKKFYREELEDYLTNSFIFDSNGSPVFDEINFKNKHFKSMLITPDGNQTKLINNELFDGNETLDENGDYYYSITPNNLNPDSAYTICAKSDIYSTFYCLNDGESSIISLDKETIKDIYSENRNFSFYEAVNYEIRSFINGNEELLFIVIIILLAITVKMRFVILSIITSVVNYRPSMQFKKNATNIVSYQKLSKYWRHNDKLKQTKKILVIFLIWFTFLLGGWVYIENQHDIADIELDEILEIESREYYDGSFEINLKRINSLEFLYIIDSEKKQDSLFKIQQIQQRKYGGLVQDDFSLILEDEEPVDPADYRQELANTQWKLNDSEGKKILTNNEIEFLEDVENSILNGKWLTYLQQFEIERIRQDLSNKYEELITLIRSPIEKLSETKRTLNKLQDIVIVIARVSLLLFFVAIQRWLYHSSIQGIQKKSRVIVKDTRILGAIILSLFITSLYIQFEENRTREDLNSMHIWVTANIQSDIKDNPDPASDLLINQSIQRFHLAINTNKQSFSEDDFRFLQEIADNFSQYELITTDQLEKSRLILKDLNDRIRKELQLYRNIEVSIILSIITGIILFAIFLFTRWQISHHKKELDFSPLPLRWGLVFLVSATIFFGIWKFIEFESMNRALLLESVEMTSQSEKFSKEVLLLLNKTGHINTKKIQNLFKREIRPQGADWGWTVDAEYPQYVVLGSMLDEHDSKEFGRLGRLITSEIDLQVEDFKKLERLLQKVKNTSESEAILGQKFNSVYNYMIFFYILAVLFVFFSVVILLELLTPYSHWLGITTDENKAKVNKYFKFIGWALVITLALLLMLITVAKSNPTEYAALLETLSPLLDKILIYEAYFFTGSDFKQAIQTFLLIPVVFSIVAIMVILYAKKKLLRYVVKLAHGEQVDPPKIRLQEFSQIVESIDTLQNRLKGKKYIETFISSIAHEVRTPLAGIRANTESLSLSMDSDNFGQAKDNIIESNNRMLLIIDSLLELAKLEQQNKTLEKTRCNINSIIEKIINETETVTRLKDKNINISFNKHNKNMITCNEILIEMCLLNIVNNAIDFSLKDSNIYINVTDNKKNLSIKILDEGVGIPDNLLDKIQDKFVSTSRPYTKKRSTGLGLNLVKIIMELHDGIFEINNRQDVKGVVAKLTFSK